MTVKKHKNIIFFILVVLFIGGAVFYFIYTKNKVNEVSIPEPSITTDDGTTVIGSSSVTLKVDEDKLNEAIKNATVPEDTIRAGWDTYNDLGLGIEVGIPPNWNLNTKSQPGKFTIRLERKEDDSNNLWVAIRKYTANINIGEEEVFRGMFGEKEAFIQDNDRCALFGETACVETKIKIPVKEGTTTIKDGATFWKVRVIEITFGAFHKFSKETLKEQGVNVLSSNDVNTHFSLPKLFIQNKGIFNDILDSFKFF